MPDQESSPFPEKRRRRSTLPALLAINAALLVVLGVVTFTPAATAQARSRGTYTMAAGGVRGTDADAVYIVDTTNQELIAITYDPNTQQIVGIGYRSLAVDIEQGGRGR